MRRLAVGLFAAASLTGFASAATVLGTPRADVLKGTPRADAIDGRGGSDTLAGLGGADVLQGGPGKDTIDAGAGDDRIPAHADGARDRIRCGAGRDIVTAEPNDTVLRDCEVVSRQISVDKTTDSIGQHATEVEPDSFAFGSTVVSVFQVGRVFEGGAVAIGFATSRDSGQTWKSGLLPGVTDSSPRPGPAERASDPVVAYDAAHRVWLAVTLGISPATSSYHLYVNRSANGLSWSAPVAAVSAPTGDLDKEWLACDNGASSPFLGRCYLSFFDIASRQIRTTFSTDGGVTWSDPAASSPFPVRGFDVNGAQPMVLPDGTLVVQYTAFAEAGPGSEIVATRSTDGGASFSAPVRVAPLATASIPAVRTFALASAEVDGAGKMYVAWEGCTGAGACPASRIVLSTSTDGISWTPAQTVTSASSAVDHFLPGLAADAATPGKLALVFHSIPDFCAVDSACAGIDVFQTTSKDGGRTWTKQQRLTAEPVALDWIARTRIGLMLGDYVSTSYVRGRPVSVYSLAAGRVKDRFRQAIFAYRGP
jgi:hypothetical protein